MASGAKAELESVDSRLECFCHTKLGGHCAWRSSPAPLGPKSFPYSLGDVGGWNATAKLDYQFAGLLNFKVRPNWTMSAGYRYVFVDYRSWSAIYNIVTDGLFWD